MALSCVGTSFVRHKSFLPHAALPVSGEQANRILQSQFDFVPASQRKIPKQKEGSNCPRDLLSGHIRYHQCYAEFCDASSYQIDYPPTATFSLPGKVRQA